MRRLGVAAAVAVVATTVAVPSARASLFFLFNPTASDAGDIVAVRLGGTPAGFRDDDRERPLRNGIRVYLVSSDIAQEVGSRHDERLHFVGRIMLDRNARGILRFKVPPLDTGAYAVAAWCPECARYSIGRSFFVQTVPEVSRYRRWMGLRVRLPSATEGCPVTGEGKYGNGFLSTTLPPDGVLVLPSEVGGTVSDKLGWLPRKGFVGRLTVRGERLDAPSPPIKVLGVFWGYASAGPAANGSWASAVRFPSEGCWRITGRVRDITLSYVLKVVARP